MSSDRLLNKVRILRIKMHLEEDSSIQMVHLVSQRIFKMCCWRIRNSISGKCLSLSLEITFQRIIENKLTSLLNVKLSCIKIKCCIWSKQKTYSYRSKYTYWTDVFRNSTKKMVLIQDPRSCLYVIDQSHTVHTDCVHVCAHQEIL